jgi:hypothetical protein
VTVPEGILPGQSINIIVPKRSEPIVDMSDENGTTVFNSVEAVRDAALLQAKGKNILLKHAIGTFHKNIP